MTSASGGWSHTAPPMSRPPMIKTERSPHLTRWLLWLAVGVGVAIVAGVIIGIAVTGTDDVASPTPAWVVEMGQSYAGDIADTSPQMSAATQRMLDEAAASYAGDIASTWDFDRGYEGDIDLGTPAPPPAWLQEVAASYAGDIAPIED